MGPLYPHGPMVGWTGGEGFVRHLTISSNAIRTHLPSASQGDSLKMGGRRPHETPVPPPTKVGQAPQLSVAERRAVNAPAATRVTTTCADVVPAGSVIVW